MKILKGKVIDIFFNINKGKIFLIAFSVASVSFATFLIIKLLYKYSNKNKILFKEKQLENSKIKQKTKYTQTENYKLEGNNLKIVKVEGSNGTKSNELIKKIKEEPLIDIKVDHKEKNPVNINTVSSIKLLIAEDIESFNKKIFALEINILNDNEKLEIANFLIDKCLQLSKLESNEIPKGVNDKILEECISKLLKQCSLELTLEISKLLIQKDYNFSINRINIFKINLLDFDEKLKLINFLIKTLGHEVNYTKGNRSELIKWLINEKLDIFDKIIPYLRIREFLDYEKLEIFNAFINKYSHLVNIYNKGELKKIERLLCIFIICLLSQSNADLKLNILKLLIQRDYNFFVNNIDIFRIEYLNSNEKLELAKSLNVALGNTIEYSNIFDISRWIEQENFELFKKCRILFFNPVSLK